MIPFSLQHYPPLAFPLSLSSSRAPLTLSFSSLPHHQIFLLPCDFLHRPAALSFLLIHLFLFFLPRFPSSLIPLRSLFPNFPHLPSLALSIPLFPFLSTCFPILTFPSLPLPHTVSSAAWGRQYQQGCLFPPFPSLPLRLPCRRHSPRHRHHINCLFRAMDATTKKTSAQRLTHVYRHLVYGARQVRGARQGGAG